MKNFVETFEFSQHKHEIETLKPMELFRNDPSSSFLVSIAEILWFRGDLTLSEV